MPYILRNLRRVPDCGLLSEEAVSASAPATSLLFVFPVATRRWVLTDNTTSTHVGELRRAAQRRSMRACRECWPERLLRRAGEVGVSGLRLGERSSMR